MTTTIIIAVVSIWVLFSAALVVFICMNSSRLSQAEELPRDHHLRRSSSRKARLVEGSATSIPAGTSIVRSGGQ
jgi:hypothetical protein